MFHTVIQPLQPQPASFSPAFAAVRSPVAQNRGFNFGNTASDVFAPAVSEVQGVSTATALTQARQQSALLPANSIVVLVPGLGSSTATMQYLFDDFKARGHKPYIVQVPQVLGAQRFSDASAWLSGEIDTIRLMEAKPRLEALHQQLTQLQQAGQNPAALLKSYFGFDASPMGESTQALTQQLLLNTNFVQDISALANLPEHASLTTPWLSKLPEGMQNSAAVQSIPLIENKLAEWMNKPPERRLARVLEQYRQAFIQGLNQLNPQSAQTALKHDKIANAVFDQLVPRIALMGHSLGGAVGYKTLQDQGQSDQHNAIFASYCLSSPVDGILQNMPYIQTPLEALYPATGDVMANSKVMRQMRVTPTPVDTTVVSFCNPADGTVKPKSTYLNEDLSGTLNLTVSPRKAGLLNMLSDRVQRIVNAIPPVRNLAQTVASSKMFEDTSGHCGLLVNPEEVWAPGADIDKRLLSGEDAPKHLARLLTPHNNEAVQRSVLMGLQEHLDANPAQRERFAELEPALMQLAQLDMPFEGSASQLAAQLLVELALPQLEQKAGQEELAPAV